MLITLRAYGVKEWNSMFWLFQTMEFRILALKTLKFSVLPFQQIVDFVFFNIGVLYFQLGFSKHWNSVLLLFKDWNPVLLLFQTLEFSILAFPDIGIQCFAFRKHSNSRILLFQTLYFSVLPYPNIAILDFGVFNIGIHCFGCSKHWTDCRFCWFFQTLEFYILAFPNIAIQCF